MALLEGKTPAEQKKTIAALALGAIAFISLSYMLFGSSSTPAKKSTTNTNSSSAKASPSPRPPISNSLNQTGELPDGIFSQPIKYEEPPLSIPEANRNIFAYYEPPPPSANTNPLPAPSLPPTPTPTPATLLLASVSPANVYARTGDFTLEVTGDKFTPAVRIQFSGTEIPTRFISAQQLSANISAALISFEGARQISVRSPDGQLFSDSLTLNVQAPPVPNYTFVGLLSKKVGSNDIALLKDKSSRDLISAQRGDLLGGRFRVTSISEREVALMDANLKIKHSLPLTVDTSSGAPGAPSTPASGFPNPNQRYTPPPQGDDDDEP